jgi:WhiB family redox-sensing transcriptional regulator
LGTSLVIGVRRATGKGDTQLSRRQEYPVLQPIEPLAATVAGPAAPPQRTRGSEPRHGEPARDLGGPWHSEAACRSDEAGLFFAPSKEPTAARLAREEAAKRVCARCPVMLECREHALLQPEPYGVWGGLTAAERRVVLARRRRRDAEASPRIAAAAAG